MIVRELRRYKIGRKILKSSILRAQQQRVRPLFKEIYLDINIQDVYILIELSIFSIVINHL